MRAEILDDKYDLLKYLSQPISSLLSLLSSFEYGNFSAWAFCVNDNRPDVKLDECDTLPEVEDEFPEASAAATEGLDVAFVEYRLRKLTNVATTNGKAV